MLDRVQLKYEAKAITKNARESAYVFTLIYLAIGLVLDGIDYLVSGSPQAEVYGYLADYMPEAAVYLRGTEPILHLPAPAVWFVSIVISLVTAVLGAGYILYTMNVRKGLITLTPPCLTDSCLRARSSCWRSCSIFSCSCGRCCSSSPASSPDTATASPCITCARIRRWA